MQADKLLQQRRHDIQQLQARCEDAYALTRQLEAVVQQANTQIEQMSTARRLQVEWAGARGLLGSSSLGTRVPG